MASHVIDGMTRQPEIQGQLLLPCSSASA
ncbi:MAG: hypothetical protein ACLUIQ_10505 [Dialister invisus]